MNDTINQKGEGAPAERLRAALAGMLAIIDDSQGVAGYHLNGNVAEWDEFPEVAEAREVLAMLATAPAAPLAHAGQRERVLVEREQLERAASVVAWMSCRSDIKAADMKRLEQCASELSCALAAPPAHPDAPRCQCCGYLVTQSEHRGCLRSASPHPVASVLVEALRAARHLLALHSGEAMPAYDAMQVVDRIDAALAGKGGAR